MDPFVAEIRIFPFNFAPKGWAFCDGQILPLSQNTALFSLLGTTYGGDGKSNFALPEHAGQCADASRAGPGPVAARSRRNRRLGDRDAARMRDSVAQPCADGCTYACAVVRAESDDGAWPVCRRAGLYRQQCRPGAIERQAIAPAGGDQPHNNMQPYLTLNFCIALQGVFPPRT